MGNNCILPELFESRMYENYFYKSWYVSYTIKN